MEKRLIKESDKPNILVVEDDPDVSQLLHYRLEQRGYRVQRMERGYAILRKLQEQRPDLIVLDLMLPDMDGLQICKLIKQTEKFADIPVVILTARGEEAHYDAMQAGADLFLKKSGFLKGIDAAVKRFCPVEAQAQLPSLASVN
jgi:DNA-binding response OmpR family regulator